MAGAIYQAKRSFSSGGRVVRAGETIREGHQLLRDHPDKFEPIRIVYENVEQATANPGQKRTTTKSKKGSA